MKNQEFNLNENIVELAHEAGVSFGEGFEFAVVFGEMEDFQKFTELLIRQCAQIGEDTDGNWNVKNEILKNFGLKP